MISHIIISASKGVIQTDTGVGDAQVFAMTASFRTIHATNPGTVAVIEQLCGKAGQHSSLGGFEYERGYGGTVLSEVYHQRLSRTYGHLLTQCELTVDDHFTELIFLRSFYILPNVCSDRSEGEICTQINFRSVRRQDVAGEFGILFGCREFVRTFVTHRLACIVLFSVKDAGMFHRAGNSSFPVFEVGTVAFLGSVRKSQFQHTAKSTFLTYHAVVSSGSYNFISPPSWCYLHG